MSFKPQKRYSVSQPSSSCDGFFSTPPMRGLNTSLNQENLSKILGDDQLLHIFSGRLDEPLEMPSTDNRLHADRKVLSPISYNRQNDGGGTPHLYKSMSQPTTNQHTPSSRLMMTMATATATSSNHLENVQSSSATATFSASGNQMQVQMSHHLKTAVSSLKAKPRPGDKGDVMASSSPTIYSAATKFQLQMHQTNSPSATSSLRSIQAMRNDRPQYFDVPHEEEFVTDEERQRAANPATTIQEVMRNVVVYVEVRTATENRSEGIKTVIAELGATVNDKLLKNTTHVIFKDGLLSSYQKARNWNIPVVSILWIEACRKHVCLMDPKGFVISNVERYDHPELYGKPPKLKSLQLATDKPRRPKNLTPKADVVLEEPQPSSQPKRIRYPNKPKDNLPNIFANFAKNLLQHTDTVDECFNKNSKILEIIRDSPGVSQAPTVPTTKKVVPTKSAARRTLFDYFNTSSERSSTADQCSVSFTDTTIMDSQEVTLNGQKNEAIEGSVAKKPSQTVNTNDNSLDVTIKETQEPSQNVTTKDNKNSSRRNSQDVQTKTQTVQNGQTESKETPYRLTRRRSLNISTTQDMSIDPPTPSKTPRNRRCTIFPSLIEETTDETFSPMNLTDIPKNAKQLESQKDCPKATPGIINELTQQNTPPQRPKVTTSTPHTVGRTNGLLNSVLQRNTIYTPQPMQETFIQQSTQPDVASPSIMAGLSDQNAVKDKPISRRRTLFTPNKVVEYDQGSNRVLERDQLLATPDVGGLSTPKQCGRAETATATTPLPPSTGPTFATPYSSRSSLLSKTSHINMAMSPATPPFTVASSAAPLDSPEPTSIIDAYNRTFSTPTFSSTRLPSANNRRTIFEMSMDIIDQRLQNINRMASARKNRSMSESDLGTEQNEPAASMTKMDPTCVASSPQLNKMGGCRTETGVDVVQPNAEAEAVAKPAPKKRKLFAPTSLGFGTPERTTSEASMRATPKLMAAKVKEPTAGKRLREDELTKPTANKRPKIVSATTLKPKTLVKTTGSNANRRRTTLDFASATKKEVTRPVKATTQMLAPKKFLVSTNMHREQTAIIKETVSTLGDFELEQNVSGQTTHLVSLEPLRTINFLRAIIRGLWILRYDWVIESAKAGRWLPEEAFEVRDFSAAVSICRSERQAFGSSYRINIFAETPLLFIGTCKCPNIRELVQQCGGRCTSSRAEAKYVISDVYESSAGGSIVSCVSAAWVLDSISIAKLKRVDKYMLTNDKTD